jgi:hypothetical protein
MNRPILGAININLAYMQCTEEGWASCFETMAHELIHVFGFNAKLYDSFVDGNGNILSPADVYE